MDRRSFVRTALGALPGALWQPSPTRSTAGPGRVAAGEDRFGEHHALGISVMDFRLSTSDAPFSRNDCSMMKRPPSVPCRSGHAGEREPVTVDSDAGLATRKARPRPVWGHAFAIVCVNRKG
jgi:hypothetical protein